MPSLNHFIRVGQDLLRCGYTTGTCAAAAARAATELLVASNPMDVVKVMTPAGIMVELEVLELQGSSEYASCAIQKDSGDDPDVTHGIKVYAQVRPIAYPGVKILGGKGIGRITKPGLDCEIGEPAINRVPRQMIKDQVEQVARNYGYDQGFEVMISIPKGEELAKRTFNPRLGIEGGLSILGTTGIVRPMSEKALIDAIELEMKMLKTANVKNILVSPGNYGASFAKEHLGIDTKHLVYCSNYLGDTIDLAVSLSFKSLILIGHIGKMIKVAAGIMNTHSRYADGRGEVLAVHAALCGANQSLVKDLMQCTTTEAGIALLDLAGLRQAVIKSILDKIQEHLSRRGGPMLIGAVVFSNQHGLLGQTERAKELLTNFGEKN